MKQLLGKAHGSERLSQVELKKQRQFIHFVFFLVIPPESLKKIIIIAYKHPAIMHTKR